jgi:hypothetical protein
MLRARRGGHPKTVQRPDTEKEKAGGGRLLSFFVGALASFACDSPRDWQKLAL